VTALMTGAYAHTSLGNATAACAAARAGLSRPCEMSRLGWDPDEGAVPIVGHAVRTVTGFQGEARLLALALPALRSVFNGSQLEKNDLGLFLALPDLSARAEIAGARPPSQIDIVDRLINDCALTSRVVARRSFIADQIGFALALRAAIDELANGRVRACIVGAVDTHCDDVSLGMLEQQGRLKTANMPVGIQPGEAAAFVVLESPDRSSAQHAASLSNIMGVATREQPTSQPGTLMGEAPYSAITELTRATGPLPAGKTWFLLDRNGEPSRAHDWACCMVRLAGQMPPMPEWDLARNFGDTGAAASALATVSAARAFSRNHAPGRCAIVMSSTDRGACGAIRLESTR
jgi:3-oxoacyl-[acyl-carrier-protein] synthase-1